VKPIGHEETFAVDHHDLEPLEREILRLADAVAGRARAAGVRGRTVQLKVKLADFRLLTRSRTLPEPVDTAAPIGATARLLLRDPDMCGLIQASGARLLGVSVSNLVEGHEEQLQLFDGAPARRRDTGDERKLTEAVDAIRSRFGTGALGPAALANRGTLRVKRPGDTQWGPNETPEQDP
jgi:DNA polymerase-4